MPTRWNGYMPANLLDSPNVFIPIGFNGIKLVYLDTLTH